MAIQKKIINGQEIAVKIRAEIKRKVSKMEPRPKLVVIQVGNDPASTVYIKGKVKACKEVGIESKVIHLALTVSPETIKQEIAELNKDASVTGILVQLPLPDKINPAEIISNIDPKKDVDCIHPYNVGGLSLGIGKLAPCTPRGCIYLIKEAGVEITGANAVIVGRSNIVGKPLIQLLLQENATVTVCHTRTKNLAKHTRQADILIAAAGVPHLIQQDMVKKGAVVIDVGITREEGEKLIGDVDFDKVQKIASAITPVPGGVGPMTIAMLLENTLICHELQHNDG